MINKSKKLPYRKVPSAEKSEVKFKIKEKQIRETSLESDIKPKLIISPETIKDEVIQDKLKPISLKKESIKKEFIKEEAVVPPIEIHKQEEIKEETVVPPEEIVEVEEKIVKDTIEAPKIEIFYCKFCGMKLSGDVIFCVRCGQKVKK